MRIQNPEAVCVASSLPIVQLACWSSCPILQTSVTLLLVIPAVGMCSVQVLYATLFHMSHPPQVMSLIPYSF